MATLSSLPPYLIGAVIEYACEDEYQTGVTLEQYVRLGCVCRGFLEALKFGAKTLKGSSLKTSNMFLRYALDTNSDKSLMSAEFDVYVKRWCDVASRRLKNVVRICDGGTYGMYNSNQTQMIVNCAASMPNLEELDLYDGEPIALCISIASNFRAGRFSRLRRLSIYPSITLGSYDHTDDRPTNPRQQAKIAFRDLITQLPADRAMDLLLWGFYPDILLRVDHEYDMWSSEFWELVARGADVHSRAILVDLIDTHEWPHDNAPDALERLYRTVETLLVVHNVDPNVQRIRPCVRKWESNMTPIWKLMDGLDSTMRDQDFDQEFDSGTLERLFRFIMRITDLLVRHGAKPEFLDYDDDEESIFTRIARRASERRLRYL